MKTFSQESRRGDGQLTIIGREEGNRIAVEMFDGFYIVDHEVLSPDTASELLNLMGQLRVLLASTSFLPKEFDHLDGKLKARRIRPVAELGHKIFHGVFPPAIAADLLSYIARQPSMPVINVRADAVVLPWDLMHPDPVGDEGPEDLRGFLGYRVLFARMTARHPKETDRVDARTRGRLGSVRIRRAGSEVNRLRVGHIFDDTLRSANLPLEERWHSPYSDVLHLDQLQELDCDPGRRTAMKALVNGFLKDGHDILHVQCHAEYQPSYPSYSMTLRIRSRYKADYPEIREWRLRGNDNNVAFLGFCDSGSSPSWRVNSFARHILQHGASCVVAVSAPVSDACAHQFTKPFYALLLSPKPVGSALFEARRSLADAIGNPCFLLFGLSGAWSATLNPAVVDANAA